MASDAVVEPGITKQMGEARLANLKDLLFNKVQNVLMGGMPKDQQEALYHTQGIKPGWLIAAPKVNAKGHKLDEAKSVELGQPVYAQ